MYKTREEWLSKAVGLLRPWFKDNGDYKVPENVKVTCGFPSRSAMPSMRQRIGECHADDNSEGKVFEIFISPVLADPWKVLDTLAHELVHAVVGLKHGHKSPFKKCALAIGLEGKMTATVPGARINEFIGKMVKELGTYPHKKLNVSNANKKCGTRLIKCECGECGYIARVTQTWINTAGAPICPQDDVAMEVVV